MFLNVIRRQRNVSNKIWNHGVNKRYFYGVSSVSNVDVVDDVRSIAVLAVIDGPWYVDDGTVDNVSSENWC